MRSSLAQLRADADALLHAADGNEWKIENMAALELARAFPSRLEMACVGIRLFEKLDAT